MDSGGFVYTIGAEMRSHGKAPSLVLGAALLAGLLMFPGVPARASACRTSGPGTYTVTLCITSPSEGDTLVGTTLVSATVSVSDGRKVRSVKFTVDTGYVLTDFEAPFTFKLPTERWTDGPHEIRAKAMIQDTPPWLSKHKIVGVTFANGVSFPIFPLFSPRTGPTPDPGQPLVVAVVGDGAGGQTTGDRVINLISSWNPNLMLYLGDVYWRGTATEFLNWYGDGDRWSRFRDITNPTVGNHEYGATPNAEGYFEYWGGPPHQYSYDVAGWHLISLDSTVKYGQTGIGSPQYEWLQSDLNASAADCTIAYFHHPTFSLAPQVEAARLKPTWSLLANEGVDLVLNGHEHNYVRWKALDANGDPDPSGTTEFIVGTGGFSQRAFASSDPRVATKYSNTLGALRVALSPGSADFSFVGVGGSVRDSGTISCTPARLSE